MKTLFVDQLKWQVPVQMASSSVGPDQLIITMKCFVPLTNSLFDIKDFTNKCSYIKELFAIGSYWQVK